MNNKDIGNRLTPPPVMENSVQLFLSPTIFFGVNIFPMLA